MLEASFEQVPQSYYALGQDAGSAFGNGFLLNIPEIMEKVKSSFETAIGELGSRLAASFRQGALSLGSAAVNTYNTTYTFNSSRDTTTQQLRAAKSAATLDRLRGGNG